MFKLAFATAFLALAALAQGPTITTPAAAVVCQPSKIIWSGGSPPYWITVIPAGQVSAQPIETLVENSQSTEYTWNVNLEAGTNVSLQVRDGTGAVQYSSPIVIQAGSSSDCLNATATSIAGSAGATGASQTGAGGAGGAGGASQTSGSAAPSGSASGSATSAASASGGAASSASSKAASASGAASSVASKPTSAGASGTAAGSAAPSAAASAPGAGFMNAASIPALAVAAVGAIAAAL